MVQQRMESTRFPEKAVALIEGHTLTWHVLNRARRAEVDETVLIMPREKTDQTQLVKDANSLGLRAIVYNGNPSDLVARHYAAAIDTDADTIVRVPSDNPCTDPHEINRAIRLFERVKPPPHYLVTTLDQNVNNNGYPGGLGAEVYSREFMTWMADTITEPRHREHPHKWAMETQRVVTTYAHPEIRYPDLKLSVDTPEELQFIRGIYSALYPTNPDFRIRDIIKYLTVDGRIKENSLG